MVGLNLLLRASGKFLLWVLLYDSCCLFDSSHLFMSLELNARLYDTEPFDVTFTLEEPNLLGCLQNQLLVCFLLFYLIIQE